MTSPTNGVWRFIKGCLKFWLTKQYSQYSEHHTLDLQHVHAHNFKKLAWCGGEVTNLILYICGRVQQILDHQNMSPFPNVCDWPYPHVLLAKNKFKKYCLSMYVFINWLFLQKMYILIFSFNVAIYLPLIVLTLTFCRSPGKRRRRSRSRSRDRRRRSRSRDRRRAR